MEADLAKDFFYACRGHLKDRGFCSPVIDEAAKKKEEMDREIELVKKEYEEKLAKKKKSKDKKDPKEEGQEGKTKEAAAQKEVEKEKDDKACAEISFRDGRATSDQLTLDQSNF